MKGAEARSRPDPYRPVYLTKVENKDMPGVPSGKGCDACRKLKKRVSGRMSPPTSGDSERRREGKRERGKEGPGGTTKLCVLTPDKQCDQTKPICKRCKRLGLECINNGVKRWKFMPQSAEMASDSPGTLVVVPAPRPRRTLSNDKTLMAASLVHVLSFEDSKHDVLQSGGQFFLDLPARIGHSPMLDASIKALVSSYHYIHHHNLDRETLATYGNALEHLRVGMLDPSCSVAHKLYAIILIGYCQVSSTLILKMSKSKSKLKSENNRVVC